MSTKDFTANVISATKVVPDGNFKDSAASGIWDINEALDLIKGGNWPNVANINPAAFVDALFQTHLYTGTGANQTITNNIDLSGEGGLVWLKGRTDPGDGAGVPNHILFDTVSGDDKYLRTSSTQAQGSGFSSLFEFNSNGFTLGSNHSINYGSGSTEYVSWTFRKQPKFFDIQTWSGDGESTRTLSHNIGGNVGMVLIKGLNETEGWQVYHRSASTGKILRLDITTAEVNLANGVDHVSGSTITLSTAGNPSYSANDSGVNYVAYIFAHNNDDGGFGEPGDQDIIKCGTYDTDGNGDATVNLGFEPQFVLVKCSTAASSWYLLDTMRGMSHDNPVENARLYADQEVAESSTQGTSGIVPTSTGFFHDGYIAASQTFIYMAIRRGGMQTPTAASDVFAIDTFGSTGDGKTPGWRSGFPVDMAIYRITSGNNDGKIASRLTALKYLRTNSTATESTDNDFTFDYNNGWYNYTGTLATYVSYMWARARGYFDTVTYTGTGSATTVAHNLGVEPEMIWVKTRDTAYNWTVFNSALGNNKGLYLNANSAAFTNTATWNNTAPTSTVFSVNNDGYTNKSGDSFMAYLFATVANVSKVGSFTQSGATNVACGFTGSTPALIVLKRTDDAGDWYLLRDIVAGNDKSFYFNTNALEITNADIVDPYSGGFATTSSLTDGDYIFYAIAAIS